ncbi:hypothetical protein [Xanthomonas phaseoli]|uniref:hypothetical protein n=1 Tax=Xanthomonas phaseoli TaxID=1985254 RepID=UPI000A86E916|nr:hypothetical protein [Xanthomonas phaseoli]MBO9718608.1 hypothetical protein [Xanthomonas phaseoli pv. manihotis]
MNCLICGSVNVDEQIVDIDGSSLGLPAGRLLGVSRTTCHDCGEVTESLPAHGAIVKEYRRQLAHLSRPLSGEEFAFLRRTLGVSGSQYADLIGVTNVTISRVENGGDVTAVQDALIRGVTMLDILTPNGLSEFSARQLESVEVDVGAVVRNHPRELTDGWQDIDAVTPEQYAANVIRFRPRARVVSYSPVDAYLSDVSFESPADSRHQIACGGN